MSGGYRRSAALLTLAVWTLPDDVFDDGDDGGAGGRSDGGPGPLLRPPQDHPVAPLLRETSLAAKEGWTV